MASNQTATPADVEKSIQIALDAADAAMDVTSEYAKVAQQIKKSTTKLTSIEKLGRIGVIIGLVTGLSVAALSIIMFLQASSKLKVLTETNTQLLTVFVENVDTFNENLSKLEPVLNNLEELTTSVDRVGVSLLTFGEKSDLATAEVQTAIEKISEIGPNVESQISNMKEETAVMNSELTLTFAETTTEEFKAQNMIMGNFTRAIIESMQKFSDQSIDIKEQRMSLQELQDVNADLSARVATLDQRLQIAKKEAQRARTAAASAKPTKKKAPSGDIIKFP